MRLWKKLTVVCIGVMIVIVGICNTLLHFQSKDMILQVTIDNAIAEHKSLVSSFAEMVQYYCDEDMDQIAKLAAIKYCFTRFSTEPSVLMHDKDTIYSDTVIVPEKILTLTRVATSQYTTINVDGQKFLIVGTKINLLTDTYDVFTVRDISHVYSRITSLGIQFAAISLLGIGLACILIMLLVRYVLQPLRQFSDAAQRISDGEYGEQVPVASDDEVGELAKSFNSMSLSVNNHIRLLKEASARQQLFISGLTHEFRTPMTSIMGLAETITYTKQPESVIRRALGQIHGQCKWMLNLMQKLLSVICLGKELVLESVAVPKLFEELAQATKGLLKIKNNKLLFNCNAENISMDPDLILSALVNLVDNACKASDIGAAIIVSARGKTIEVADHGLGIPKDKLQYVLQPFYTVDDSRSKRVSGSGLGLAIVKQIADAHNATLEIDSAPQKGTTVRIVFP